MKVPRGSTPSLQEDSRQREVSVHRRKSRARAMNAARSNEPRGTALSYLACVAKSVSVSRIGELPRDRPAVCFQHLEKSVEVVGKRVLDVPPAHQRLGGLFDSLLEVKAYRLVIHGWIGMGEHDGGVEIALRLSSQDLGDCPRQDERLPLKPRAESFRIRSSTGRKKLRPRPRDQGFSRSAGDGVGRRFPSASFRPACF